MLVRYAVFYISYLLIFNHLQNQDFLDDALE